MVTVTYHPSCKTCIFLGKSCRGKGFLEYKTCKRRVSTTEVSKECLGCLFCGDECDPPNPKFFEQWGKCKTWAPQ